MCSGRSRTARETQNIPLAVAEQSIAPLKEMLKRSLPASSHLADREVFPFLFSLPKKPIPERVNGLGLGLTMCKRIIELHDGVIWAESSPAGGSAFHVRLPVDEQEEEKSPTPLGDANVH